MNPLLLAALRRHWRIIGALFALAVFTLVHQLLYLPAAGRYRAALASVGGMDAAFDPGSRQTVLPPRVYALIADNSLGAQDAQDRGGSGALGVIFLERLGRVAAASGVRILSTEPGTVAQEPLTTLVPVHLVATGRYDDILDFFDQLSRQPALMMVDRFTIRPGDGNLDVLELWVSRLYLKQPEPKP